MGLSQGGVIWMPLWLLQLDGIGTLYGVRMASQDNITSPFKHILMLYCCDYIGKLYFSCL